MRKLLTHVTKAIPIILLMLAFIGANAQRRYSPLAVGDIRFTLNNDVQVNSKVLEFDVYLLDTDNTNAFEMATCQAGVIVNSGIYNGGAITVAIVAGSSEMLAAQQPATVNWVQSQNCLKLTPRTPPGATFGTTIGTTGLGTKVCRLRITNSVDFKANTTANLAFCFTTVPYPTKCNEYISGVNTAVTIAAANAYSQLTNVVLNGGSPPTPYVVGGTGSYCEGQSGLAVTLPNSQTGTNYQLYKNTVAQGTPVAGTDGTPLAPVAWTNQTAGTYTIKGTNGTGSTDMTGSAIITMNPLPVAAGTISGTASVVHGTYAVAYSVGAITNATGYFWAYSGNGATIHNGTTNSITIDFAPDATSGNLTVYGTNACGNGTVSANFGVTIGSGMLTWTAGDGTSDWGDPYNWSPNTVPQADDNILVPNVGFHSPIIYSGLGLCKNAEVQVGANINVMGSLTVAQTITLDGGLNLTVSGSYIDHGIAGAGTMNYGVGFYNTLGRWHYMSPPISDGKSGIYTGAWLVTYSSQYANGWLTYNYILDPGVDLHATQGYASYIPAGSYWGLDFAGHFNSNAEGYSCITQTTPAGTGYNLVGNPYPSSIDLGSGAITWPSANHTAYFWDPDQETYKVYTTVTPTHTQFVPPTQAFFIEAPVAGTFQVPNSARLHSTEAFLKDAVVYPNVLNLSATSQVNNKVDQAVVGFVAGTTTGYDFNYDAAKLAGGTETPQIYSLLSDNMKVAYNIQPFVTENTVVPMGFTCGVNGNYTLNASNLESFDASCRIYLEDLKEGMIQDIKANPVYNFNYTTGDAANRFVLHFSNPLGINDQHANGVQVYTFESSLYIKNLSNQSLKNVFVYDLLGKAVFSSALNQNPLQKFVTTLNQGYYVVKVVSETGVTTQKVYIN